MPIIAICDDNLCTRNTVGDVVKGYGAEKHQDFELVFFNNPKEMMEYPGNFQILFLDVEMPEQDGFEAAKELRARGYELPIIFITSHTERMQEAFEVNAFRYICKPLAQEEIIQALEGALTLISKKYYVVIDGTMIKIEDVVYLEALGEGCALHLCDGIVTSRISLKAALEILENAFYQCHKSYGINLRKIIAFNDDSVTLKNGSKVPVSTRKRAEIKKVFRDYISKHAKIM